jgi:hypothetical protein
MLSTHLQFKAQDSVVSPAKPRRKYRTPGPISGLLRHAVRISRQHLPCTRTLNADTVGDEIINGITRLSDRELNVLAEVYRVLAPIT